jgi:hypothetical protein
MPAIIVLNVILAIGAIAGCIGPLYGAVRKEAQQPA